MSVFNSCLLYISSGDSPLWHHPAELPEGRGAVQSQEIWRGKMVSNTATPVVSFSAGGQDNSSTRVSFPVFFSLSFQVSEAQIEASLAQSPASQLSLKPGIKSPYDSGAISLSTSDLPLWLKTTTLASKKKKRKTRGHWWRDTFWQNAVTLQLMLQSMDLKKNLTNQFGLALRWGT